MSRMREVRMSTSCSRAVKECGWHYPLSTEEQVYPFIHHHHHHQRIHTHTAHSLFTENIWTQLPAQQRGEQQFLLPLEFGGRENKQDRYLHTGKKEKLTPIPPHGSLTNMGVTEPDERQRERHEDHQHHWAISRCHICYMFLHHCSVEKMNLEHGGYRTNCIDW